MNKETNPKQYGPTDNRQEELELMPTNFKRKSVHDALIHFLDDGEKGTGDLKAKIRIASGDTCAIVQSDEISAREFHPKDENISSYIEKFEKDAQDDIIALGSLSKKQDFKCQEEFSQSERKLFHARSNHIFKKTESQLLNAANAHKEEILAKLGNLTEMNNDSNGATELCWKLGWSHKPQPFQIQFKCLRGVKDKIPKGHYVLKASLLSRLGGHPLHWSKVESQLWSETSLPVYHNGRFYDVEITLNYSMYTLLPTGKKIKSGMTLLIELYLLHGKDTYMDRAVGWGVFPLCDNNFNLIEGKFKCPFLRGHYDSRIDRFKKIEDLLMADVDHWLCNLYFQVIKLPSHLSQQPEYGIFVQLPQEFLTYASHDERNSVFEEDTLKSVLRRDKSKHLHQEITNSSCHFNCSQGQPLASHRELNIQEELIPSTEENMETQLNIMKEEMEISKERQTNIHQKSLMHYYQVKETSKQGIVKNITRKMCRKGIPPNKIVPYEDKQSISMKEEFDINRKVKITFFMHHSLKNNSFYTTRISNMHFLVVSSLVFKGSFDVHDKSKKLTFCEISSTGRPFIAANTPFL
uniref:Uncharacterized protein n=1 Tax=Leptobrachium leishanense TaxID=445787 RepID=A0A8C5Q946_9ANUR